MVEFYFSSDFSSLLMLIDPIAIDSCTDNSFSFVLLVFHHAMPCSDGGYPTAGGFSEGKNSSHHQSNFRYICTLHTSRIFKNPSKPYMLWSNQSSFSSHVVL